MMWIVRLALKQPYTIVVLAILIFLFGGLSIVRTPTDIFPNIDIPVVGIVWTYNSPDPGARALRPGYIGAGTQRLWSQLHSATAGHGARFRRPLPVWGKAAPGTSGLKHSGLAGEGSFSLGCGQCYRGSKSNSPHGNIQNRFEGI